MTKFRAKFNAIHETKCKKCVLLRIEYAKEQIDYITETYDKVLKLYL